MLFPTTPLTLLGRLKHREMSRLWDRSWDDFFSIYQYAVTVCVEGAFNRNGWFDVPPEDLQDVMLTVFESLIKSHESFVSAKGKFRAFLTTICQRRVVDFIRSHSRGPSKLTYLDPKVFAKKNSPFASYFTVEDNREEEAFRSALHGTMLAAFRAEVPPRTNLIFELVTLNGESPKEVAAKLRVGRDVIDNTVYKARKKLREIYQREEIQQEL